MFGEGSSFLYKIDRMVTEICNLGRSLDRKESDLNDSVKIVVGIA